MIRSNFFSTFQKKIDKLDIGTIKNFLYDLIEENENIKNIFNSMKEAVIVLDKNMTINFYNKMAIKILKINTKKTIGLTINDIIENAHFKNLIYQAINKEEKIDNQEFFFNAEPVKYITYSLHPVVNKGTIIGNILIIDDITQDKENKNRLRRAESLAALTTISAAIAHEIRNPLGAISIHVQLLEQELSKDETIKNNNIQYSLDVIKEEIERLTHILNDYLMTVRPLNAELMPVNLNDFLNKFIDFIRPELETYKIKIEKKYSILPEVWLDERFFKQALLNLIKNAIAAIQESGIIEIEAYQKKNYVVINITDNGDGIPPDIQSHIFDPYFTTKNFGTGLGLTIVYKIIQEHRGEINFSSKKGETVFSIKLPLSYIKNGLIEYSGVSE